MEILLTNFGGNQTWQALGYRPPDVEEVKRLLEIHRRGQVRCVGGRHSWSAAAASLDAAFDLSLFDRVEIFEREGVKLVRVGAGCTLQALLDRLHAQSDQTLPTLGVIKRQTIAGAISTGTHGSGRPSLSHFVEEVVLAAYDPHTRKPAIFTYRDNDEALQAARCAAGCMGVILEVVLRTVPKYLVEEKVTVYRHLKEVLALYKSHPLTQFTFTPYRWDFIVFQRTPLPGTALTLRQKLAACFWGLYVRIVLDFFVHLGVWLAIRTGKRSVRFALTVAPYAFFLIRRTDAADRVLTQRHDLFRHEEMELFVPASRIQDALRILQCATQVFAGQQSALAEELQPALGGFYDELIEQRGSYTHHYAFFIRRVPPEDNTLISMTAGCGEAFFSIGVFTYLPPGKRLAYYAFCRWLARCMSGRLGARLHWGKHFPLGAADMAKHYPQLDRFRKLCEATDPQGVFRNRYAVRVLGFAQ